MNQTNHLSGIIFSNQDFVKEEKINLMRAVDDTCIQAYTVDQHPHLTADL